MRVRGQWQFARAAFCYYCLDYVKSPLIKHSKPSTSVPSGNKMLMPSEGNDFDNTQVMTIPWI